MGGRRKLDVETQTAAGLVDLIGTAAEVAEIELSIWREAETNGDASRRELAERKIRQGLRDIYEAARKLHERFFAQTFGGQAP